MGFANYYHTAKSKRPCLSRLSTIINHSKTRSPGGGIRTKVFGMLTSHAKKNPLLGNKDYAITTFPQACFLSSEAALPWTMCCHCGLRPGSTAKHGDKTAISRMATKWMIHREIHPWRKLDRSYTLQGPWKKGRGKGIT